MQAGFTLIELMIVVAIIGILAAIAIPAYQDYTKRTHVAEGMTLAGGAKTALAEFYMNNGRFPPSNESAGLADATDIKGNAVDQVDAADGVIEISYNTKVASGAIMNVSAVTGAGSMKWKCKSGSAAMEDKWLPSACK